MAAQENLGVVLVQRTLVVADSRHVLNHDSVIRVFALLIQDRVRLDHIVDDIALGNLLGPELALGAQVLAVVVAEVVVARDGGQLDARVDEEVDEGGFHLGLAGFEVVAADEGAVAGGEVDGAGDECVLRRPVDEGRRFEDAGYGEDGRGGDLFVPLLDGLEEVVCRVVDAGDDVGVALRVRGPLHDDLV